MCRTCRFLIALLLMSANFNFNHCIAQSSRETLTLPEAIEIAKQNYPAIKRKIAEKEAREFEFAAAKTVYLPSFIVQGQIVDATSNQLRGTFFPNEGTAIPVSGGIKVNGYTSDAVWSSFVTGLVNWKFFNFGKYKAGLDVARASLTSADADYQNQVFQHVVRVCDTYLVDLMLKNMLRSQQANLARVKSLRDVTASYVKAGLKPGVDSSLVNAEYSKASLQFLEAQRIAKEENLLLKELLALGGSEEIVLDTTVFAHRILFDLPLHDTYGENPRLRLAKSVANLNEQRVFAIRRRELPSISLLVSGWGRGSGISDKLLDDGTFVYNKSLSAGIPLRAFNYMVGVSTIWNVTSIFRTREEAHAQQSIARMAHEYYNEENLAVQTEWEKSKLRYRAALAALQQTPIQLQAARDAYAQAKARYDAGLATVLELTQTYALLNRAEVDATLAQGNVWQAILQYAGATGDLTVFTDNFK